MSVNATHASCRGSVPRAKNSPSTGGTELLGPGIHSMAVRNNPSSGSVFRFCPVLCRRDGSFFHCARLLPESAWRSWRRKNPSKIDILVFGLLLGLMGRLRSGQGRIRGSGYRPQRPHEQMFLFLFLPADAGYFGDQSTESTDSTPQYAEIRFPLAFGGVQQRSSLVTLPAHLLFSSRT